MYKAKISIGDFKAGAIVPEEQALEWMKMYKESPVQFFPDEPSEKPIPVESVEEIETQVSTPEKSTDLSWINDYMSRNSNIVLKSLEEDETDFDEEILQALLDYERSNKKRIKICDMLNNMLAGE